MTKNKILILGVCAILLGPELSASLVPAWEKSNLSQDIGEVHSIYSDPASTKGVFLAGSSGIFLTDLAAVRSKISRLLSEETFDLHVSEGGQRLYASTINGLKLSADKGKSWKNILTGQKAFCSLEERGSIFIGTERGLFLKKGKEIALRIPGDMGQSAIRILRRSSKGILAVSGNEVYLVAPDTMVVEKIFEEKLDEVDDITDEENVIRPFIRAVESIEGWIYVVTNDGFYRGTGERNRWEKLPAEGLSLEDVETLVFVEGRSPESVPCMGGSRGVLCYLNAQWTALNQGIATETVLVLRKTSQGGLIAAGEGIFVLPKASENDLLAMSGIVPGEMCSFNDYRRVSARFSGEPSVQVVQKMAILYSDTDKRKIDSWHRQSRFKAFLPSVSAGVDRNNSDIYRWDTGPNPDVLQKGPHAYDWDVSVSWDLGDVIWSTNQTSIDSRSKMMAELREDILDQVTRLYFERRRIQIELVSCQYPTAGEKMAAEMRVHELTSHLDAYTNGDFSKKVNHNSNT